ncbi:MAG: DegT/DnrJ/EryC1/StrS family aminotransferase, partial [Pseudomonadales bacterium]
EVMKSGRLHRYNTVEGELSEVDQLELEFAEYMGQKYALACSSGGYALHVAMRAVGVKKGDLVLCNAFTLAPVPGAIHNAGGVPVLVDVGEDFCIDLEDLATKAQDSGARFLLLSHMRGHIVDMDEVMAICKRHDIIVIEDCAHTMGARWNGQLSGTFGEVACFSMQTYKHINSGEGGFLSSNNPEVMARAIMHSGSYMLFGKHKAAPDEEVFAQIKYETPNYSGRMDSLRAAILRPQLKDLNRQCERWNKRYRIIEQVINQSRVLNIPARPAQEQFVASSIQFSALGWSEQKICALVDLAAQRGVVLKWFGADTPEGYTSRYDSWHYIEKMPHLPRTEHHLSSLLDMRIPLTFSEEDCQLLGEIICEVAEEINAQEA